MLATTLMKHYNLLRIFFYFEFAAFVITCYSCYSGQNIKRIEITDTATLRREILKSIVVPFEQVDTVILCETSGVVECGNLTEAEIAGLPKPFFIKIDTNPFMDEFIKGKNFKVVSSKAFFDSISFNGCDSAYKNKIQMFIDAEISDDGTIIVHENYVLNGIYKNIGKVFYLDSKHKWKYE